MSWEIGISILLFGFVFTFAYLAIKIDKKHGILQLFFLFLSLYSTIIALSIGIELAKTNALTKIANILTSLYQIAIYASIVILFYFIIIMIWNIFSEKKMKDENDE